MIAGVRGGALRRGLLALLTIAVATVAALVFSAPAGAHAVVVSIAPADTERLPEPPREVVVRFGEEVSVAAGHLRVFDSRARRVDDGVPGHPGGDGRTVRVGLRAGLPDGTYLVGWRVVSADSHPVEGSSVFVVGTGPLARSAGNADGTDAGGSAMVGGLLGLARWLGFAGLAVFGGGILMLAACWPGGRYRPRARRLLAGGWVTAAAGTGIALVAQGPYAAGTGPADLLSLGLLGTTVSGPAGPALLVRVALLGTAAATLRLRRPLPGVLVAALLPAAWALSGHAVAATHPALAVTVDALHLTAMAAWLGGLAVLAGCVLRAGGTGDGPAADALVVRRFSRLAAVSVGVLVATGSWQAWRQTGSLAAVTGTGYGRWLIAKLAVVVVLIGVAGISRALVHRRTASPATPGSTVRVPDLVPATDGGSLTTLARPTAAPSTAPVRALRRTVLVETVLALLVLGLTTMLVGQPPARTALHLPYAGTLALPGGRGTVQLSVAPATLGPDQVHVYVFDGTGQLADPQDVRVDADPPPGTASRVSVTLTRAGPAHFIGTVLLPATGTWQLRVRVALSEFEAPIVVAAVPVT